MKNKLKILIILFAIVSAANASETRLQKEQSAEIKTILEKEKKTSDTANIIDIINTIDDTYANLYQNLLSGKKLVFYFDPAHGRLPNGEWQGGAATNRLSCTKKTEESYSIPIARLLYKKLVSNPFIEVKTTKDYIDVLKGTSEEYKHTPFSTSVRLAKEYNAFMMISEHLNNVSIVHKASGVANIPGLHVIHDWNDRKILKFVNGSYSGFLTLYNKFDSSGFSRLYALKLKEHLVAKGLKANNWEFGAVGDSRFSYFTDFPISVIYESGFISNPDEEKKLSQTDYITTITDAQYNSLIENIRDVFGVDISGDKPELTGKNPKNEIEMLKLSRIAVYYIKQTETEKALAVIGIMEKKYSTTEYSNFMNYFLTVRQRIIGAEGLYKTSVQLAKKKNYRLSSHYMAKAASFVGYEPIYSSYLKKYNRDIIRETAASSVASIPVQKPLKKAIFPQKSYLTTPVILTIEEGQTVEEAVELALAPDTETLKKLVREVKAANEVKYINVKTFSKKPNKNIFEKRKILEKPDYSKGIFVLTLNNKMNVTSIARVHSIILDTARYQNQQFLKNSHFARSEREKDL